MPAEPVRRAVAGLAVVALALVATGCSAGSPSATLSTGTTTSAPAASASSSPPASSAPASSAPPSTASPTASATSPGPPGDGSVHLYTVDGRSTALYCFGTGSPTVVVIPGLTAPGSLWRRVASASAEQSGARVCSYDRPGLGTSEARRPSATPTIGRVATELGVLLRKAGLEPPFVVVGHSYGGMVARMFVSQQRTDVRGVVMVDASTVGELRSPYFADVHWWEGGNSVDVPASIRELDASGTFGSTPLVVLTQDASGTYRDQWYPLQDSLAALSTDSVHVVVKGAGHLIQDDNPPIVEAAITDVVTAARTGAPLPDCATTFTSLGGRCLG